MSSRNVILSSKTNVEQNRCAISKHNLGMMTADFERFLSCLEIGDEVNKIVYQYDSTRNPTLEPLRFTITPEALGPILSWQDYVYQVLLKVRF